PTREWNQVHQHPPNPMPLCFSARRAKASQVEASSGLIAYSLMRPAIEESTRSARGHLGTAAKLFTSVDRNLDVEDRSAVDGFEGCDMHRCRRLDRGDRDPVDADRVRPVG